MHSSLVIITNQKQDIVLLQR